MRYSTPTAAQRKKDSMDAAERSGIAKGIPQGTLPLPCLSGEGWKSELAVPRSCYAHHGLNRDFSRPMHFPRRKRPTRQWARHSADTDLSAPYKRWEKSHTTPRQGANSQRAEVSEKIKQKRRKEPKKKKKNLSLQQPGMTPTPQEESPLEYGSTCGARFLQGLEGTAVYLCHTDKEKSLAVIHKTNEQVDHHVKNTEYWEKKYIKYFFL